MMPEHFQKRGPTQNAASVSDATRSRPQLRFRRIGISIVKWAVYSTLDLGRIYVNLDFGWHGRWKWNLYVGGRWRVAR